MNRCFESSVQTRPHFAALKPLKAPTKPSSQSVSVAEYRGSISDSSSYPDISYFDSAYHWLLPYIGSQSFGNSLPKMNPNSQHIMTAVAFLVTRVITAIDFNEIATVEQLKTLPGIIFIKNCAIGVALVTLADNTSLYVLEASGEVIGQTSVYDDKVIEALRPDWREYVQDHKEEASCNGRRPSLCGHIRSLDEETFSEGISKHFVRQLGLLQDVQLATQLLKAAQAYTIGHLAVGSDLKGCVTSTS